MIATLDFTEHEKFLEYCRQPASAIDLEKGAWLLARTRFPSIDIEERHMELNLFAVELSRRMNVNAGVREWLDTINDYLFEELGFRGNRDNYYEADNSYLNRVLERRTGIPITLSLVYLCVAKRLRLPVAGIGAPGHFICRAETETGELYIDPFNGGEYLSRATCAARVRRAVGHCDESALAPSSPSEILARMCGNLYAIYKQAEHPAEARWHEEYMRALRG